jgi:hypothetical protein
MRTFQAVLASLAYLVCGLDARAGSITCYVLNCVPGQLNYNNGSVVSGKYPNCSGSSYNTGILSNNNTDQIVFFIADGLTYGYSGTVVGKKTSTGTLAGATFTCAMRGENGSVFLDLETGGVYSPPTNYYCVYNVCWTNSTSPARYANPKIFFTDGTNVTEFADETFQGIAVKPGDRWCPGSITNNLGTNGSLSCPQIWIVDTRYGATNDATDLYANGTRYGTTGTSPSNGNGGTGTQTPGPITGSPGGPGTGSGGSTNPATQGDVYKGADVIAGAIAELENAIERARRQEGTNSANQLQETRTWGSNTVGQISGMNSNLTWNLNTNFALLSSNLFGIGTNLVGLGTNMGRIATNTADLAQMTSNSIWGQSNAAYSTLSNYLAVTNFDIPASNTLAGVGNAVSNLQSYGTTGVGAALDAWNANGNGYGAPSNWGVLRCEVLGHLIYEIDGKELLALEPIEDRVPGFRAWLRVIVIWAVLLMLISFYMDALREAFIDILQIPPSAAELKKMMAQMIGLAVGGPLGSLLGSSVGVLMSLGTIVSIIAALMFLPSIFVASFSTIQAMTGFGASHLASGAAAAVFGPGNYLQYFLYYTSAWFPTFEIVIVMLNYLGVRFILNGTVCFFAAWFKIRPLVNPAE